MKKFLAAVGLLYAWSWYVDNRARKQAVERERERYGRFLRGAMTRGEGTVDRIRRAGGA